MPEDNRTVAEQLAALHAAVATLADRVEQLENVLEQRAEWAEERNERRRTEINELRREQGRRIEDLQSENYRLQDKLRELERRSGRGW